MRAETERQRRRVTMYALHARVRCNNQPLNFGDLEGTKFTLSIYMLPLSRDR